MADAATINLLKNYDLSNQTEVPPLKLLLMPHARALHERQVEPSNQLLIEQRNDERERLEAAARAKRVPLEAARDAKIAKVMEAAHKRCAKITANYEAQIDPIRSELKRGIDVCYSKCFHATERHKEPMETAVTDAWNEGRRSGWKQCCFYYRYQDGSTPGCHVWFRPEDEESDCDRFGSLEAACDSFNGCDRHLTICPNCRFTLYDTVECSLCEDCDCEEGHKESACCEPEYFCESHFELHRELCLEAHSRLCGYNCEEGKMMPGYCKRTITADNRVDCSHECGIQMCQACAWRCDGVEADDGWSGGGTRECGRCYCKQCLPSSLKADLASDLARRQASGDTGSSAQYCGHCLGDGCDYDEEQERKRTRRSAHNSLARGEYVHPSHYMDEDAYHERFG
jgi:hypothetical protein